MGVGGKLTLSANVLAGEGDGEKVAHFGELGVEQRGQASVA
ncbi:hypothetical protein [Methylosinus sp. H3A]|nr:hypothetical protein [Methylosinus sp. H3A]